MTQFEQEQASKNFLNIWKDKGSERSDAQKFWIQLLREVYGVQNSEQYIDFELPVKIKNTSFADGFIADTKVLIEMKGKDIDLTKPEKQSDGEMLTPFQQAKRYADELVYDYGVRWIIVSNFQEIHIYDMRKRHQDPEILLLKNLPKEYYRLQFLVNEKDENIKREEEISFEAGKIIGKLYDEIKPLYENPEDEETLQNLNKLCVRLVFCLYAEDANLFGTRLMFHDYLNKFSGEDIRERLLELFEILNTPVENRSAYLREDLKAFPYVNGGLFDGEIEIPRLNDNVKNILLNEASEHFDWTDISPTIFGGVFESTLNPETRRSGGMHYTSVENIRKVIRPLFLDDIQYEYETIKAETTIKSKKQKLQDFQNKIANLKFLDPACGSGNFLTQTYLELRSIENEVIKELIRIDKKQIDDQIQFGHDIANPIKVSINQFYGIEINDFAVAVAKTALWIAEHQMFEKTRAITYMKTEFLPLKTYTNIIEGNALRVNWDEVVDKNQLNYIMGNPPFVGARMMAQGSEQKKEIESIFGKIKDVQDLDYVTGWYKKAGEFIQNTGIEVGFVSTNSICQGVQVPILWSILINELKLIINFAYRTFRWDSEASLKAHVHCIIVGFSCKNRKGKIIYENEKLIKARNINPYLIDADTVFITAQKNTICDIPKMNFGNQPRDGGNFILTEDEKNELIKIEPGIEKWIHPYMGAEEFINNKKRFCIWTKDVTPSEIKASKILYDRIAKVKEFRDNSNAKTTNGYAKVPHMFAQITQPDNTNYLIIPSVSSEKRRYIPIGFMDSNVISSNAVQIIPNATLYIFGILTSNVHMAWMRTVAGRLKSDYRYSKEIVYNTFPWPSINAEQKNKIEKTAQGILVAREKYPNSTLADLYDELTMPIELRKAHQENDKAVMEAYGFDWRKMSEAECVAELMKMYQELVK